MRITASYASGKMVRIATSAGGSDRGFCGIKRDPSRWLVFELPLAARVAVREGGDLAVIAIPHVAEIVGRDDPFHGLAHTVDATGFESPAGYAVCPDGVVQRDLVDRRHLSRIEHEARQRPVVVRHVDADDGPSLPPEAVDADVQPPADCGDSVDWVAPTELLFSLTQSVEARLAAAVVAGHRTVQLPRRPAAGRAFLIDERRPRPDDPKVD